MDTQRLTTADFDYHLPDKLIAQTPPEVRGQSRLLVVEGGTSKLVDRQFGAIVELIAPGDLLVLNSTKVRHARLIGRRPSGAAAEVLLIHPSTDDSWIAMGKPGSALKPGKRIQLGTDAAIETVAVLEGANRRVRFIGLTAEAAMERYGQLPLPPYIERPPNANDDDRYQTVYAEREGSVAAPTAGLHFTPELLAQLVSRGVTVGKLDLEVGPGTFRPIEVDNPAEHAMHQESYQIGDQLAAQYADVRRRAGKVWAVGTTVVRALESASSLEGNLRTGPNATSLLILPGYRFMAVDRLITNFHLPRSTLLMLVSAFGGIETIRRAYRHAIASQYRFFSYGDSMTIIPD